VLTVSEIAYQRSCLLSTYYHIELELVFLVLKVLVLVLVVRAGAEDKSLGNVSDVLYLQVSKECNLVRVSEIA